MNHIHLTQPENLPTAETRHVPEIYDMSQIPPELLKPTLYDKPPLFDGTEEQEGKKKLIEQQERTRTEDERRKNRNLAKQRRKKARKIKNKRRKKLERAKKQKRRKEQKQPWINN